MFYSDNYRLKRLKVEDLSYFKDTDAVSDISIWSDLSPCALKVFNLILLMTVYYYYDNVITFDVFHALTGENRRKLHSVVKELRNLEFFEYNHIRSERIEKAFSQINLHFTNMFSFSLSAELMHELDFLLLNIKLTLCPDFFGMNVRYYRRRRILTQEQLAAEADLCPKTIQLIESGERRPSYESLVSLCRALKCTPNDLMCALHFGYSENLPFLH